MHSTPAAMHLRLYTDSDTTCRSHRRRAPYSGHLLLDAPRLYQISISPLSVRTSITAWPKKSSLSLVNFLRIFARKSLSSSLETFRRVTTCTTSAYTARHNGLVQTQFLEKNH